MPKGNIVKLIDCASNTMSFPCGYTYVGDKKAKSITIRLHKKKCPQCSSITTITFDEFECLPTNLDKKDISSISTNRLINRNDLHNFDILI